MADKDDSSSEPQDYIDLLLERWTQVRPEVDWSPMAVSARIRLLALVLDAGTAAVGERHGVKRGELEILIALVRCGAHYSATPTELARQVWITAASITRRIDQLVKLGLVERERDSLNDRREVLVRLTARGRDMALTASGEVLESVAALVNRLEAGERQMMVSSMRKLLLQFDIGDMTPPGRFPRGTRGQAGRGGKA